MSSYAGERYGYSGGFPGRIGSLFAWAGGRQQRYTRSRLDLNVLDEQVKKQWRYLDAMARAFPA